MMNNTENNQLAAEAKKKDRPKSRIRKKLAIGLIFLLEAIALYFEGTNPEIVWVGIILLLTIYLFAFEIVDVDIAALTIMVVLGLPICSRRLWGWKKAWCRRNIYSTGFRAMQSSR